MNRIIKTPQLLLLPLAVLSLVLGLLSGLLRMGWSFPVSYAVGQHGALMVGSFLGTLICLERAVVFKSRWALLAPLLSGLSLPAFGMGYPYAGLLLLLGGSLGMAVMTFLFLGWYRHSYYYLLFGGSVCLIIGHVVLLSTGFYPLAVPWWFAFLLLTIVAERLELSRFLPIRPWQQSLLWLSVAVFLLGVAQPFHGLGQPITGAGMLMIAAWLLRYDMAFKSIKKQGQPHYSGVLLIMGYCWLILCGLLFLFPLPGGYWYDASLHTFFLGFVFSMIFAHAPIILPGVLGQVGKYYHPSLYTWPLLSSLALGVRLAGDLLPYTDLRAAGGLVQAICLVGFFLNMVVIIKGPSTSSSHS
ncbi:hypothetical protein [Telluribacter humicola]|uniref:hypothetical protein n=1 Tax=Telluribacter humicola TaxID=1720261 RepID=UPI001A965E97|nr:hypothetical protein [Telluribacter humicola]